MISCVFSRKLPEKAINRKGCGRAGDFFFFPAIFFLVIYLSAKWRQIPFPPPSPSEEGRASFRIVIRMYIISVCLVEVKGLIFFKEKKKRKRNGVESIHNHLGCYLDLEFLQFIADMTSS